MSQSNQTSKLETIENTPSDKTVESIEVVKLETIATPDYSYGQSQNTLEAKTALRGTFTNYKTGYFSPGVGVPSNDILVNFPVKMVVIRGATSNYTYGTWTPEDGTFSISESGGSISTTNILQGTSSAVVTAIKGGVRVTYTHGGANINYVYAIYG